MASCRISLQLLLSVSMQRTDSFWFTVTKQMDATRDPFCVDLKFEKRCTNSSAYDVTRANVLTLETPTYFTSALSTVTLRSGTLREWKAVG